MNAPVVNLHVFKKIEAFIILDKRLLNSNGVTLTKPFNLLAAISTPFKEG
jgi:hypothetical protein